MRKGRLAGFTILVLLGLLVLLAAAGRDQRTGLPNTLGWIILAVIAGSALWLSRYF